MQQIARFGLKAAAVFAGVCVRPHLYMAYRWRECGTEGLYDRSSRPAFCPCQIQADKRERIIRLRCNYRLPYAEIASRTGISIATMVRICLQASVGKSPPLQAALPSAAMRDKHPRDPAYGYEEARAGCVRAVASPLTQANSHVCRIIMPRM